MAKTLVEGTGMETLGGFLKSVAKRVWGEREWSSTILKNIWQNLCVNFQMFKLLLEKAEEPEIKLPISAGSSKKQESSRKTSTSVLLTMPKPLLCGQNKLWKILKETGIPDHLTCLLRNLYAGQEATVRTGHEQTGSK